MNPDHGPLFGAIIGITVGALAMFAWGWWGVPVTLAATLIGVAVGDRY